MPETEMVQNWLRKKVADLLFVELEEIDINEPFANYGLGSADAVGLSGEMEEWLEQRLSPTLFFDYPCIAAVANYLVHGTNPAAWKEAEQAQAEAIAIIGIGCRFPGGANTPEKFWELLKMGFDAMVDVPANRWDVDAFYSSDLDAPGKMYIRSGGFLPDLDQFDATFFGISPHEAVQMHPQQRMLLEVAWEAFENAGQKISTLGGSNTGVFVGIINMQDYAQLQVQSGDTSYLDNPYFMLGNSSNIAAGRLSYIFDFKGPNLTIDTACSSSLVAAHLACQSLRHKECNLALVGGVSTYLLPEHVVNSCKIRMLSPTGHCRTFDADADGSSIGEGCGMVVLKRLSDALADQDTILAVIRGSAVNQDGRSNGITAPNKLAQEAVIQQALANAGVEPHQVGYVEAHGSGTPLGDPIEVEALVATLGQARSTHTPEHPLVIGSVKTNIGHLAGAAGIAGLIKTVLVLSHKEIPPHLHLKERNPYIRWDACPITIPTNCRAWPEEETARVAGVNSFGWSGTNVHILLEEGPVPMVAEPSSRAAALLLLSTKTESALELATDNLLAYLKRHPEVNLADVAYTSQTTRTVFTHRRMLVCESVQDAIATLEQRDTSKILTSKENQRSVTFLFPDAAEHFVNMARPLYQQEPVFREWVDTCCRLLQRHLGLDLRENLYPCSQPLPSDEKSNGAVRSEQNGFARINHTVLAHAATFVTNYALAQLLISWGIVPEALLGYKLGEYVAACVAGVFSLEDALLLVTCRAQDIVSEESTGIPECEAGATWISTITLHEPQIACLSAVTGSWITREQSTDPAYWAKHLYHPTALAQGVALLLQKSERVFLEVGVGQELSSFVKQHPLCDRKHLPLILACLPVVADSPPRSDALITTLGKLWLASISINWQGFSAHEQRAIVPLPTYPFERQRYWIQQQKPGRSVPATLASQEITLDQMKREEMGNWFSLPGWKSSSPRTPFVAPSSVQATTSWIFFLDDYEIGTALLEKLLHQSATCSVVTPGKAFSRSGKQAYTVHPTSGADYATLFQYICTQTCTDIRIVHLWTLTDPQSNPELSDLASFERATQKGFSSVLAMVQALEHVSFDTCQITLVSNGIQDVLGNEIIFPEKATLLGPCLVIPFEYPDITCRSVDIALPEAGSWQREALLSQLLGEITSEAHEPLVALRSDRRWLPVMERLQLAEQSAPTDVLREKGVYLITGGLGGIGLAMAEYLARTVHARLILVGRSALPPREDWPQLSASLTKKDRLGRQLQAIQRIEALGGQVLLLQADVTNQAQMQEVIQQTCATFGTLHGVLHAAGVPGVGLIQLKTPEQAASVLAPKVLGTLVLEQVLANLSLDFLVLFSSITSFTGGGPGQMDYTAANAFLDAYAHRNHQRHGRTIALDWGEWEWNAWEEGLSGYSKDVQHFLKQHRQRFGITFAEGTEALGRLLTSRQPRVIISTQEMQTFTDLLKSSFSTSLGHQVQQGNQERPKYPRPALASSYTPPRNSLEQTIVGIWEELLGVEPVGIYDNFFELGGNSLVGINLLTRMRKTLHLENFPAHVLYEAPSVSNLAQYIRQGQDSGTIKERQERGEKRRAGLTQRLETTRRRK
ncbi:MAG: SDR family NAD(P)-dependent oxidoreductase [Ktedonobacteraceae bacterium]